MTARFNNALVGLAASVLASGCSPIVGGACVEGTVVCDGRCVDLLTDDSACGGCGNACATGSSCRSGTCSVEHVEDAAVDVSWGDTAADPDAGVPADVGPNDAAYDVDRLPDGAAFDSGMGSDAGMGSVGDGSVGDGSVGDAGPTTCDLGQEPCDGVCVDTRGDVRHCGGCGRSCAPGELCASGACVERCGPGTVACLDECVDTTSDPDHCGGCGRACPTGLCEMGMCTGALAGHLVVIGHDYSVNRGAMNRILANAVFQSGATPVEILSYEGTAAAPSIAGARSAIDGTASSMGRAVAWRAPVPEARVPLALADADVFLIHAQAGGTDLDLDRMGATWSVALDTFLARGGIVIVLDVMAAHRGTWGALEAAGLLSADHIEEATGSLVSIVAPADAVAVGVPLSYRAERTSVRLLGADLPIVASDSLGPVVLHRTVVP